MSFLDACYLLSGTLTLFYNPHLLLDCIRRVQDIGSSIHKLSRISRPRSLKVLLDLDELMSTHFNVTVVS